MKFLQGDFSGRNVIPLHVYYNQGSNYKPDDVLDIVYKDLDNGKKYVETIINPLLEIWIVKPEHRTFTHIRDFYPKENCYKTYVPYKSRFQAAAKELGVSIDDARVSPYILQIDMKIEHFYLMQFILEYPTDKPRKLSLGYLDIENDIIRLAGFPQPGEAPINAVTYIDEMRRKCYTVVLGKDNLPDVGPEHPGYTEIQEMKDSFYRQLDTIRNDMNELYKTCHDKFDASYGIFDYEIMFFDNELDLLNTLWTIVRNCDTDYSLVWNLPYDAQNLETRPRVLGYDPAGLIVDDKFGRGRKVLFIEDTNPLIQKRRHIANLYTTTTWVDQMVEYVGIRAGGGKLPSAKLTKVAMAELKDGKLDYSEETDIKHLFYKNLLKFILYNIKDVLLQYGVENKNHDIAVVYDRLYNNFTQLNESFVTTAIVLNSLRSFAYDKGNQIMGINKNRLTSGNLSMEEYLKQAQEEELFVGEDSDEDDEDEIYSDEDNEIEDSARAKRKDDKYDGAMVLNPNHMLPTGISIMGQASKFVHDLMADLDVGSEYPTAFIIMNASNETMVGKVVLENPADVKIPRYPIFIFKDDELVKYKEDPGNFLLEVLSQDDTFNFGELFLSLPNPSTILDQIEAHISELIK